MKGNIGFCSATVKERATITITSQRNQKKGCTVKTVSVLTDSYITVLVWAFKVKTHVLKTQKKHI